MKKARRLDLPCTFEGEPGTFRVYLGRPAPDFHPLHYQSAWLRETRGGIIAEEVLERVARLHRS